MKKRIDLYEVHNPNCKTGCSKEKRKVNSENDLCVNTNSVIDELPIRCVGEWAIKKIFCLVQYFGIFTQGMKNRWGNNLNYIEICSGPGRCISRENGKEFNGTALSIVRHQHFPILKNALFFDSNEDVVATLNLRIKALNKPTAKAFVGDYNYPESICNVLRSNVDEGSLNLVLIDPTDCSVPFSLIKEIKGVIPNVDFIINLASGTDYNRNVVNAFLNKESFANTISKYSKFLGNWEFFDDSANFRLAQQYKHMELRNRFRDTYKESMRELGYKHFAFTRILHFYDLLFATKHPTGLDFWEKATKIDIDGQRQLF